MSPPCLIPAYPRTETLGKLQEILQNFIKLICFLAFSFEIL